MNGVIMIKNIATILSEIKDAIEVRYTLHDDSYIVGENRNGQWYLRAHRKDHSPYWHDGIKICDSVDHMIDFITDCEMVCIEDYAAYLKEFCPEVYVSISRVYSRECVISKMKIGVEP